VIEREQREKWGTEGILGFGGGVEPFIGLGQSAASIGSVESPRWIDQSPVLHRAACQLEEDDDLSSRNGMPGWTEELRCRAGLMGYSQVSPFLFFFFFSFFSFCFIFCFVFLI
jgi:hypothetical protein